MHPLRRHLNDRVVPRGQDVYSHEVRALLAALAFPTFDSSHSPVHVDVDLGICRVLMV